MGAVMFSFFHEAGHELIDILDICAAVGREEDSVDQLATLILIAAGDEGISMALSGAHYFKMQQDSGSKMPFSDEHAFDGQRFYNIMCLIYGSNPDKYQDFVKNGALPAERAARCPDEYRKIQAAWETLLEPHLTNGAATNVDYKPSVPVQEARRRARRTTRGTPTACRTRETHAAPPESCVDDQPDGSCAVNIEPCDHVRAGRDQGDRADRRGRAAEGEGDDARADRGAPAAPRGAAPRHRATDHRAVREGELVRTLRAGAVMDAERARRR